jgi:hypothetical protein
LPPNSRKTEKITVAIALFKQGYCRMRIVASINICHAAQSSGNALPHGTTKGAMARQPDARRRRRSRGLRSDGESEEQSSA